VTIFFACRVLHLTFFLFPLPLLVPLTHGELNR